MARWIETRIDVPDHGAVDQGELVQVGQVPAAEGVVDGLGRCSKVWLGAAAKIRPGRGQ